MLCLSLVWEFTSRQSDIHPKTFSGRVSQKPLFLSVQQSDNFYSGNRMNTASL
jgi:hypothetical protein